MKIFTSGAWARLLNAGLGVWLMAAPAVLGYGAPASTSDRLVGPIAASFAIIAIWEATRAVRRVNSAAGVWLVIAPFLLGFGRTAMINSMLVGISMLILSRVRGEVSGSYGGGWRALWRRAD
ncbi:MAG: hypothetical protein WD766_13835 [Gemmatimonadota bacterium]